MEYISYYCRPNGVTYEGGMLYVLERDLGSIETDTRASPRKSSGGAHDKRHSIIAVRTIRGH